MFSAVGNFIPYFRGLPLVLIAMPTCKLSLLSVISYFEFLYLFLSEAKFSAISFNVFPCS